MITGGSTANLAVILVDARTGVITQTRRHTFLVSLLGIKHIVLAVNKMDLVDFSREVFDNIVAEFRAFIAPFGVPDVQCIPLSALEDSTWWNPATAHRGTKVPASCNSSRTYTSKATTT